MSTRRSALTAALLASAALSGCAGNGPVNQERAAPTPRVSPCLMFQDGNAEQAMNFYVGCFPDGRVISIKRFGPGAPSPEGKVELGVFEVRGQRILCTDSPPVHSFDFTPSVSLFVECVSEADFDARTAALSVGGEFLMPPADYGFSKKFAWINDRYGVSWQVNLPGE